MNPLKPFDMPIPKTSLRIYVSQFIDVSVKHMRNEQARQDVH